MNISVCCPSYKRPIVKTLKYLPFCKVYVDGSEYVVFTCEGKRLSLECQYYYFGKKTGDKVKDINSRTGEVWIWLLAS